MSLAERLKKTRKSLNLSQKEVADAVPMSQPSYQALESGRNTTSKYLPAIAKVLKSDIYWLIHGENPRYTEDGIMLPPGTLDIDDWEDGTPLDSDEVEIKFFKDFKLACGSGSIGEALESEWRRLRLSKSTLRSLGIQKENAVAMRAEGNSMLPEIKDGSTVFVDLGRKTIKDGKVFAICHGGLFKFKRLYALPMGGVRIVSDNAEEYPEERLTAQEVTEQEFHIIGWAWSWHTVEAW